MSVDEARRSVSDVAGTGFEAFMAEAEPRVRRALIPIAGVDAARDATLDALVEAWRRWDRVRSMENPVGYVYTIARRRLPRRSLPDSLPLPAELPSTAEPAHAEPALVRLLLGLPERQRTAVYLITGCGWSAPEVAQMTGVAATTVRTHLDRGLQRLRLELGADPEEDAS